MKTDDLRARLEYEVGFKLVGKPLLRMVRWQDGRRMRAHKDRADNPLNPPLTCTLRMKELMTGHYLEGRYAEGVRKVAWVTSGAPVEILKALDFFLIYPENHAAVCGARKRAEDLCIHAENEGYSRDICSYARTDIGSALSGETPVGKLPKPDLLLCCTNICQTVLYWYRVLAAHFGVPLYVIDTPFLYEDAKVHQVDYVVKQLEGLVPVAEKVAGKTMDYARLKEITRRSRDACDLWLEILDLSQRRPAPMTAFDGFINMGPIVDLRGDLETIEFYHTMLRELQDRVSKGIGAIKEERKRVLWDNLPIWYRIGWLSKLLGRHGVNVVASTYTYAWGELAPMIDAERPLESGARVYLHPILNRSTGDKLRSIRKMVDAFECDGAILHSDRSCKPYSLGQMDQRDALVNSLSVPALLLEADHSDPRSFSDEQAAGRLEAFIEMMEGN